jgi:uncharacterized membrane protein
LSTSDTNIRAPKKHIRKTTAVYLALSLLAVVVNYVYGLYGHGVHSGYMTWMFLYPLLGGVMFYNLISLTIPGAIRVPRYRMFFNIYNSGIAVLTVGSFLKGILYIAGTDSPYTSYFDAAGWMLVAAGMIVLFSIVIRNRKRLGPISL